MPKTIYAPGLSGIGTRERAKAFIGKPFDPGWCLYWCLVHVFKVPGVADYDADGDPDAEDYLKAARDRGKFISSTKWRDFPPGVLILWTGGSNDNGHAAYCLGNGEMVSTDLPKRGRVGRVSIDLPRTQWGLKLVGYVLVDGNGFTLTKPVKVDPPVKLDKPVKYTVTASGGLKGRNGPSEEADQVWLAKEGATVQAVAIATGGGRKWAVTKNGTHYALEFLKLKD